MSSRTKALSIWIIMSMIVIACTVSFGGSELSEEELLQTAVFQTVSANQT